MESRTNVIVISSLVTNTSGLGLLGLWDIVGSVMMRDENLNEHPHLLTLVTALSIIILRIIKKIF